jgi:uncharacterized membrane protein SirB2
MLEFYPQIKFVHVACVVLSGSLFAVRGMLSMANSSLVDHAMLRFASYTIDTTLLTAALMLATMLHQYPFAQAWLTAKVLLLIVYIVLGTYALRRAHTRRARGACLIAALAILMFMASIAHTHNAFGLLRA